MSAPAFDTRRRWLVMTAAALLTISACTHREEDGATSTTGESGHRHGSEAAPAQTAAQGGGETGDAAPAVEGAADEIAYWTCSMHPSVKSPDPGQCPICSMDLVPVRRGETDDGAVSISPERRQLIGVRTAAAERRPLDLTLRTVGRVTYDESALSDVTVKYDGWIDELYADSTGRRVEKGEPLFTLYSPALFAAQQELLTAIRSRAAAPDRAGYLVRAARTRLKLWDLTDAQIDEIARAGVPSQHVAVLAPASGHVVEKNVVEGAAVKAGDRLFRIAKLDTVWVEAELYESQLSLVSAGDVVRVSFPYRGGAPVEGRVTLVYPFLEDATRTGRARVEIANADLALKPDMYADVTFTADLGERLVVPKDAVLYAGPRRFVFVDLGDGRLAPREVEVGAAGDDAIEIVSGVGEGDLVVTSGNFLVAAESRLKLAIEHWK
jgi:Cu(I)/Ag(I) efflux system membrane fusion protein